MKRITTSPKIVGAYFTNDTTLSTSGVSQPHWFENKSESGFSYLPVLNCIKINGNEEFKFCADDGGEGLTAYNANNRHMPLAADVVKSRKIDVTPNDLFCGDIDMILNFTDSSVNVVSDNYHAKEYAPIHRSQKFSDYEGGLIVLSLFTLNAPKRLYERYGYSNYFATLAKQYAGKPGPINLELFNTYDFLVKCLTQPGTSAVALADTVKVAKAYYLSPMAMTFSKGPSLYFSSKRMLFSRDNPLTCAPHPEMSKDLRDDTGVIETIRANGVSCFIVDNDDALGDRYYNFAGVVTLVPKMKDKEKADGLYILPIDASKRVIADNIIPLDKVDESGFLFKSREEANTGADKRTQYKDDVEINKLNLTNETIELKRESEEKERSAASLVAQLRLESEMAMNAMRLENERTVSQMKLENERTRDADRLAHEREMSELRRGDAKAKRDADDERARIKTELEMRKQETENARFYYDMRKTNTDTSILGYKQDYEEGRYRRDGTVETIKTVGAITGLVLGGMMLYSKHNS